jgi:hypothetical protein
MKVYEYSPFFNEARVLQIKLREADRWVDEVHLCEADRTFSYSPKPLYLASILKQQAHGPQLERRVRAHALVSDGVFRAPSAEAIYYDPSRHGVGDFDRWYWQLLSGNAAYHNEAVQRNRAISVLARHVRDDDLVILSDVDEIIDSRHAEFIASETAKHGIITVKLHYSVFYLNLFTASNHGMPHFSYRLFVMTGRYFRTLPFSPDYLRKRGIEGGFRDFIHCPEQVLGFHHSWLDHEQNAFPKLQAFAANVADQSIIDPGYAVRCLNDRRLHYLDAELYVDNDKPFLASLSDTDTSGLWFQDEPSSRVTA